MRVKVNAFVSLALLLFSLTGFSIVATGSESLSTGPSLGAAVQGQTPSQSDQQKPETPPANAPTKEGTQPPAKASKPKTNVVWVNTDSKLYHRAGSKWYGKTRHGKYMTEGDAIKAGYHAAEKE